MADTITPAHSDPADRYFTYRFTKRGSSETEERAFRNDTEAERYARDLSKSTQAPVLIERRDHVDWEYVTEADER